MKTIAANLFLLVSIGFVARGPLLAKSKTSVSTPVENSISCEPIYIMQELTRELGMIWNEGNVRAGQASGEFLSAPYSRPLPELTANLKRIFHDKCSVHISDLGGYTVRFTSLKTSKENATAPKPVDPNLVTMDQFISSEGTTLGILSPAKEERLVIVYAAKIASAIVKKQGELRHHGFSELSQEFDCEQDIEYRFGKVRVSIINGRFSKSISEVAALVFKQLSHLNYRPMIGYEDEVRKFDAWIKPEKHESFWSTPLGVIRVELKKIKNGKVSLGLHETREMRDEPSISPVSERVSQPKKQ